MKRFISCAVFFAVLTWLACLEQAQAANIPAYFGDLNSDRVETVERSSLKQGRGVCLKSDVEEAKDPLATPDIVLHAKVKEAGTYRFWSNAAATESAKQRLVTSHSKMDSIPIRISINGSLVSSRYVILPWRNLDYCETRLGLFDLPPGELTIQIWLPTGVILESLDYSLYQPPKVPEEALRYEPKIVPPATHPRILVRPELLPGIRERLTQGDNQPVWEYVQATAQKTFEIQWPQGTAVGHNSNLIRAIQAKAFVYLMTGDKTVGREAVDLTVQYLNRVEYGNLLDITREIGTTIYSASWVYDWCFPLLTESERQSLELNLRRLANQMECGWPPFGQTIVNGHGAEAQIMRDLLTMSIALYDVDPEPYRYCSWRVLEQLVPMRRWEYDSPRHNQGINYGNYRVQFEYYSDFLFHRMSGQRVFDANLGQLPLYFLAMRVPNGQAFADGDCYNRGILQYAPAALIMAAYCGEQARDQAQEQLKEAESAKTTGPAAATQLPLETIARLIKGQYYRERARRMGREDSVFFLLVNDPNLTPDYSFDALPLGFDSGNRLGSQILRTAWPDQNWLKDGKTTDPESRDVVVELKGAGYATKNHQHLDAGAFQIYYRGWLAADLGIYHFYGLPYDMNFNKGSSAHNVCLILDEKAPEKIGGLVRDGGQIVTPAVPQTPTDLENDPRFKTGTVLESSFEPSAQAPNRSRYRVDLTPAYRDRADSYIRSFRWLKTNRADVPVVLVVLDKITVKDPAMRRFWQINTLCKPEEPLDPEKQPNPAEQTGQNGPSFIAAGILPEGAHGNPGRLALTTLLPAPEERSWDFIGAERANSIFGVPFSVPVDIPQAKGWRALLEDKNSNGSATTVFLNVLQVLGDASEAPDAADATPAAPLPVQWREQGSRYEITVGDQKIEIE